MNKLILFYQENKRRIYLLLFVLIILLCINKLIKVEINNNYTNYYINNNALIFNVKDNKETINKKNTKINTMQNLGNDNTTIKKSTPTDKVINLKDTLDNKEISKIQKTKNIKDYNNYVKEQKIQIFKLDIPKEERSSQIYLKKLGIKKKLIGNYPTNNQEILIGENLASSLMKKDKITKMADLINYKLIINQKEYIISGIYEKTEDALIQKEESAYIYEKSKFSSTKYIYFKNIDDKREFIKDNKNNIVIIKQIKEKLIFNYIMIIIFIIISNFILFILLYKKIIFFINYICNLLSIRKFQIRRKIFLLLLLFNIVWIYILLVI